MIEYEAFIQSWTRVFPRRPLLSDSEYGEFSQARDAIEEASRDTNISVEMALEHQHCVEDE